MALLSTLSRPLLPRLTAATLPLLCAAHSPLYGLNERGFPQLQGVSVQTVLICFHTAPVLQRVHSPLLRAWSARSTFEAGWLS